MNVSWEDARLFLGVADAGSISGAARGLKIGQPTVTRRLALLEHQLGTALFRRSPTGVALTAAGERLVLPARRMAEWANAFNQVAEVNDTSPTGVVRVTAPPLLAASLVLRGAALVREKYPGVTLEVSADVKRLDLGRGEADLAIRSQAAHHADLVTVVSWRGPAAIFASPKLKAALPKRPTIADVPWVAWAPPFDDVPPNPQLRAALPDWKPVFLADNFLVLVAAVEAGLGATVLPKWAWALPSGATLVALDVPLGPAAMTELHLVCARSALDLPRVRAVVRVFETLFARGASR